MMGRSDWMLPAVLLMSASLLAQGAVPALPSHDGALEISAQEWPLQPGERMIKIHLRYPDKTKGLQSVNADTGIMLSLHNWGGVAFGGTADPDFLAPKYNVIVIGVDYLQSSKRLPIHDKPYDHGWLQALDALRALYFVFDALQRENIPFASDRIFAVGGSGGGNVSLMANKLAPRTFAAVVDVSGMKKLSDEVAFGELPPPGLNARYSRDPSSPFFLDPAAQELRFIGHPDHLQSMKNLGASAKVISVHGRLDEKCSFAEAEEFARNMAGAGLDFEFYPITPAEFDGKAIRAEDHSLGDRTLIVDKVAGSYLAAEGGRTLRRSGKTDFERQEQIRYKVKGGEWIIDYGKGFPVGSFEKRP